MPKNSRCVKSKNNIILATVYPGSEFAVCQKKNCEAIAFCCLRLKIYFQMVIQQKKRLKNQSLLR